MAHHSEQSTVVLSLRGEAVAESAPERATATLVIAVDGPDRSEVRARSTRAIAECIDSVTRLHDTVAGPVVDWTSDDLQVWAERPWSNDGTQLPLVFHSRATLAVTFTDFIRLSLWLDETADRNDVSVGGVAWAITDLTRRELEARAQRDAVAHALDKASVYASSLGLVTVTPVTLSEPSAAARPFGQDDTRMFATAAGTPSDFAPSPIRVSVEIDVTFAATP
ncbi:uncharacterized protein YggE [Mycetocola sp. CAN_C7]|uniref:SIMPL domain-containing protein n=1 Tax=Mycetocola sp. CAN_C7 TaxID=2787724 RepID=UPI0018CB8556